MMYLKNVLVNPTLRITGFTDHVTADVQERADQVIKALMLMSEICRCRYHRKIEIDDGYQYHAYVLTRHPG